MKHVLRHSLGGGVRLLVLEGHCRTPEGRRVELPSALCAANHKLPAHATSCSAAVNKRPECPDTWSEMLRNFRSTPTWAPRCLRMPHSPFPRAPLLVATPGCPSRALPKPRDRATGGSVPQSQRAPARMADLRPIAVNGLAWLCQRRTRARRSGPGLRVTQSSATTQSPCGPNAPSADLVAAARRSSHSVRPSAGQTPRRRTRPRPASLRATRLRRYGTPRHARPANRQRPLR